MFKEKDVKVLRDMGFKVETKKKRGTLFRKGPKEERWEQSSREKGTT